MLFVLDASIGNYDFKIFQNEITDMIWLVYFGNIYTMIIVICFNILILNLIIAILANTYNMFDHRSKGLYLSKILNARDELQFNLHYGSMLLTMTPLNIVVIPFVPYALFFQPSAKLNNLLMIAQYSVLINVFFVFFLTGSILMLPFAFFKGLYVKINLAMRSVKKADRVKNWTKLFFFFFLGVPILIINLFTDFFYFWKNNFRDNLKKIIITKITSQLTSSSIKSLKFTAMQYMDEKIKAVHCRDFVKLFRTRMNINTHLQYLIYGQLITDDCDQRNDMN